VTIGEMILSVFINNTKYVDYILMFSMRGRNQLILPVSQISINWLKTERASAIEQWLNKI